jgi:hypothetical protein
MIERVLSRAAVSELQIQLVLAATALAAFGGLLVQDKIHPFLVYLLQIYLVF